MYWQIRAREALDIELLEQGHVHIFKNLAWRDSEQAFGGLDQIVSSCAAMLAAKRVGEDERLGELLCTNEKASAVDVPVFGGTGEGMRRRIGGHETRSRL